MWLVEARKMHPGLDDNRPLYEAILSSHKYTYEPKRERNRLRMVRYLVEQGADVNARKGEMLFTAVIQNDFKIARYLVEQGADISARDYLAISTAAVVDDEQILKMLLPMVEKTVGDAIQADLMEFTEQGGQVHPDLLNLIEAHDLEVTVGHTGQGDYRIKSL
jgi:hypothetical protein